VAVKSKQNVSGFKLDGKTVYAWFCDGLEPLASVTSPSSLKQKAQNNFGRIQYKCQGEVEDGKSKRIAYNSKTKKPNSKPRKSKQVLPLPVCVPPSIEMTNTIESNSYRQYLIQDFLFTNVGNHLLLQIALLDHPHFAAYSSLDNSSVPKPLHHISGRTFFQLLCIITLHSRCAKLIGGMLDCHEVRHLLFKNGDWQKLQNGHGQRPHPYPGIVCQQYQSAQQTVGKSTRI
jgi:hypothetical protein